MTADLEPSQFRHWDNIDAADEYEALGTMRDLAGDTSSITHSDGAGRVWSETHAYGIDLERRRITALPRNPPQVVTDAMPLSRAMSFLTMTRSALELVDEHGCESFVFGRCFDEGSGKTRGAEFGADAWCSACIARDALNMMDGAP